MNQETIEDTVKRHERWVEEQEAAISRHRAWSEEQETAISRHRAWLEEHEAVGRLLVDIDHGGAAPVTTDPLR